MKHRLVVLPALAGLLFVSARLISAEELPAKVKATTKSAEDGSGPTVGFHTSTGIGVFQDVQVPIRKRDGFSGDEVRGDGKTVGEDLADHMGIPLAAGLTLRGGDPAKLAFDGDLGYLMMRASSGPAETQSSSYERTDLAGGARYAFGQGTWRPTLAGRGILRRSSFNNVSNGHYVNAVLVRGAVGVWSSRLRLEAYAGYAPYTELGFSNGKAPFGGERFDGGSASMGELGLVYSQKIYEAVWLELGVEQENIHARIGRVAEYNSLGLSVTPVAAAREFDLVTSTARIGVRKEF